MLRLLWFLVLLIQTSQSLYALQSGYAPLVPHPRLLLRSHEEALAKDVIQNNPSLQSIHQNILAQCRQFLKQPPVERVKEGKRLLGISRTALKRIFYLSYAYRMTGEDAYFQRAEREMLAVCNFPDWNPSHFLDVGEMTLALGIGYDWLFDKLPPDSRQRIRRAIMEKGFAPSENTKYAWFYRTDNNWNSVCNAGLLFGALAIYEDIPDTSRKIIERCIESNPKALKAYAPQGVYPEGYGYWAYGTSFQVLLIAALESALGSDFGLTHSPGFLESAYFLQMMCAPDGNSFNFSDCGHKSTVNPAMLWLARKLKDPTVLWVEKEMMAQQNVSFAEDRLLPTAIIYSIGLDFGAISPPERHIWSARQSVPLFVYRSNWTSSETTYLAIKGGKASASHGHMDAGSFIFVDDGVRWAMDLGMQDYHSLESKGVDLWDFSQNSQRWEVFRLGASAHNTLTVNGQRHLAQGFAPLLETIDSPRKKGAVFDLTPVLQESIRHAIRTVILDTKSNLFVKDILENSDTTALIRWVMCTPAQAEITGENRIELRQGDKRRILEVVPSRGRVKMKVWTNDPPNHYDAPNPRSRRVGFEIILPPRERLIVRTKLLKQ